MLRDNGTYECRAMNVVSKQPSVRRIRVFVTGPKPGGGKGQGKNHHSSSFATSTVEGVKKCSVLEFCLNGGTCSLYEGIGEYVCQ